MENYQLTAAAEQTAEFSQEQNRGNSERGERYDQGRINGNLQTDSSRLDRGKSPKKGRDGLGATSSEKEWSTLDREKQQQIINQLDAYTYSSEEAEIVLPLYVEGDISNEDIRREAVTEMARQFYEAMQGNRVLLENDGRFRWLGDMVGLLIEDVQAIQDGTFVADEFWEQEQRRDYIDEGYATDSTNWAYENFIIDETDRARFYEVIADLNKRNYSVPRNKNGVYMIEHNNKIMFTDGDFKAPTLSKVIVFDTNYDANMAYAKGLIFDEERRTAGHGEAVELLNRMYGDGFIHEYNVRNYQRNDWQDGRGEGSNRRSAGKAGSGRRIFKGQYQERTSPLTDRDVLEAAANDIGISDMSDAEQAALQTFKDRLAELHELQEKRAEAGRLYKEQQFGANVDRQAAAQTLERMYELDKQIAAASRKVLGAENSKVLKPILQYVRKSVEKKERERSKAVLERWRDRRDNAEAMTDILPDSHFVQNLAEKHKSIFQKLMEKLKEFVEDLRSYFDSLGKNRSREANALKEQVGETVRYVENIVKMFDQVAEQAVENYQLTGEVIEKPGVVQYQSSHLSEKSLQEWHRNYKNQEDSFSKDIDVWNREGRPPKATFLLGSTGDVLQGLGAIESDIYMLGDKISIILEKHKEMTLNEIKRIPEILNDPVMILKSRNVGRGDKSNTRIVVFGSLKAQNGQPVLAVMDLRPVEKGFRIDNMQKIDSAYTKTASRTKSMAENGRAFVKSSDVLYLDKKRTTRLLSAIGFYMPITCNRSGYIGSISYNGENVNIRGAKFSDVISESFDLEQEQRRDYQKYSYEWFVSKPDMPMTIIGVNSYNNQKEVVHQAKVNAAASGSVNPKDGSVSIYVDDIGTDIVLGTKGLRHGLDRRFNLLAPITVKAGEIIKNSILINEITPKDNGSTECYALIGIAKATDGEIYIVRSIVNRYGNELASMDVLYAINAKNAKKEPAGRLSPQGGQHESSNPSGSKVSIASLLSIVNRHFPDVLSEV